MSEFCYASPLGTILLTAQDGALIGAAFVDEPAEATLPTDPVLLQAIAWLDRYFAGDDPGPIPPVQTHGTAFQSKVWSALGLIPYGETVSYADLAARCGFSKAHARAVGAAVGKNPLAIFLPCHRVLANHGLGGYAFGLDCKRKLLELETL